MQYVFWRWSKNNISNDKTPRKKNDDISKKKKTEEVVDSKNKFELNKRELCNDRISQRVMHIQTNINPFINKNDYVKNISTRDDFLRPLDSNY